MTTGELESWGSFKLIFEISNCFFSILISIALRRRGIWNVLLYHNADQHKR